MSFDDLLQKIWHERTRRPDPPRPRRVKRGYGAGTKIPRDKRKRINRARRRQRRKTIQAQRARQRK